MKPKSIKIKNLLTNSLILSSPGFVSIFLSLLSIPIHLKFAGLENYGNYILFHIILSLSLFLNLGISKTIVISSNFEKKYLNKIAYEAIKYSCYIILTIIIFYIPTKIIINENFNNIFSLELLFIGLIITIIYLTFEGILQANRFFKIISVINFIFYSLSLSLPSILLIFFNEMSLNELICLSIIIKIFIILFLIVYFINNRLIIKNSNKNFFKYFKKNSPWLSLNSALVQLYEMMDKYLIKIFMGSSVLAIYSIPQQLTGKLSILSKAFSSFLLPNMNSKNQLDEFIFSLEIFIRYIPILVFILFPFYPTILEFWLGDKYSELIFELTKIFSLIAIFSCLSHILVTKYEADQNSRRNFRIELFVLPFFLITLTYLVFNFKSILLISLLILIKEILLVLLRIYFLSTKIKRTKKYLFYLFIFPFLLILSFFNMNIFYISLTILIILTIRNVKQNN